MNDRKENRELIERMAKTLREHVEPYQQGAWERFAAAHGQPTGKVVRWPYWAAAAMVLLAAGLFWLNRESVESDHTPFAQAPQETLVEQPESSETPKDIEAPTITTEVPTTIETAEADRLALQQRTEIPAQQAAKPAVSTRSTPEDTGVTQRIAQTITQPADEGETPPPSVSDERDNESDPASDRVAAVVEDPTPEQPVDPLLESEVLTETATAAIPAERASRESIPGKWQVGVAVSPSLTSEKVNMGGGLTVSYQLSEKFSVGSGVAVAQLGVGQNPNYDPYRGGDMQYQDMPVPNSGFGGYAKSEAVYRQEQTTTSSLVALDIPLDLKYNVTKNFYAAVGVSFVAVLNETRTNHFVDQINRVTLESSAGNTLEKVYKSERAPNSPLEGKRYNSGFMNFSVGRKMPISSKLFLSIEPYFKLPIGSLSREEMDFTNGGIRIVTGF